MLSLALALLLHGHPPKPQAQVPLTGAVSLDASNGDPVEKEGAYPAVNVADDDAKTAWVANGRRLVVGFLPVKVAAVSLLPGYGKSAALWAANRRVKKLRYRFYPKPGPHQDFSIPGDWKEVDVAAPERFSTAEAMLVTLPMASSGVVVALELEVAEATPKTRSDDICISTVRVVPVGAPPPCPEDRWRYSTSVYGTSTGFNEEEVPPFAYIDFVACEMKDEGTGDGLSTFKGTCTKVKGGVRLTGSTTSFDGERTDPPRPYDQTLSVRRYGCGIAVIDGHPYTPGVFPDDGE